MSTTKSPQPIKLSRIVFEGPIQIGSMTVREYAVISGQPARYDAHLHGDLQCILLRDPADDVTIYIPLRCVRSMEVYDKHNVQPAKIPSARTPRYTEPKQLQAREPVAPALSVSYEQATGESAVSAAPPAPSAEDDDPFEEPTTQSVEPKRRGRPRTKFMGPPSDKL